MLEASVEILEDEVKYEKRKVDYFMTHSQDLAVYPGLFGTGAAYGIVIVSNRPFTPCTCDEPSLMKVGKVVERDSCDVNENQVD